MKKVKSIALLLFTFILIGCTTTLIDRYKTIENPQKEGITLILTSEKEKVTKLKDEIFSKEGKKANIEKGIQGFTAIFVILPFL